MFKYILSLLNRGVPKEMPILVGRWRRETCNKALNLKIDLSNEDHCGPCGEYALEKIKFKNTLVEINKGLKL
jgi:hypothetical protein